MVLLFITKNFRQGSSGNHKTSYKKPVRPKSMGAMLCRLSKFSKRHMGTAKRIFPHNVDIIHQHLNYIKEEKDGKFKEHQKR